MDIHVYLYIFGHGLFYNVPHRTSYCKVTRFLCIRLFNLLALVPGAGIFRLALCCLLSLVISFDHVIILKHMTITCKQALSAWIHIYMTDWSVVTRQVSGLCMCVLSQWIIKILWSQVSQHGFLTFSDIWIVRLIYQVPLIRHVSTLRRPSFCYTLQWRTTLSKKKEKKTYTLQWRTTLLKKEEKKTENKFIVV